MIRGRDGLIKAQGISAVELGFVFDDFPAWDDGTATVDCYQAAIGVGQGVSIV